MLEEFYETTISYNYKSKESKDDFTNYKPIVLNCVVATRKDLYKDVAI